MWRGPQLLSFSVTLSFWLCLLSIKPECLLSKKNRTYLKGALKNLRNQKLPTYHSAVLDWNLTQQLSAPRYMLNLFYNLNSTEDESQSFNVSNVTTTKNVGGADTIMGILNDASDNLVKSSTQHMQFKFNFSAKIRSNESVKLAEFHIYKDFPNYSWMKNASFLVELMAITIPGNPMKLGSSLEKRVVEGWKTGWEIFDVTKTVDRWIVSPGNNYGLAVSVRSLQSHSPIRVDAGKFGFVGFKGPYGQRPFIVSFFKGDPTQRSLIVHPSQRKRRSVFSPRTLKYGNSAATTECKKRYLYVDFSELHWENWIIAPDGYEAYYCAGECTYGSYTPKNASNHAIVQTLVNLLNQDSVPSPCCAPTKLNAISVLYYDEKQNVVLKKFKDMVVKSCGCH